MRAQTSKNFVGTAVSPDPPAHDGGIMRMTVYFQQAEWDALRDRADKDDTTMATLVRKAVRSHLKLK